MTKSTPEQLSPDASRLGEWQASCGPSQNTSQKFSYVVFAICIVISIALFFVPTFVSGATPRDAALAPIFFRAFAVILILIGTSTLVIPFFFAPTEIHLFKKGLVMKLGDKERIVAWDSIEQVKLFEWYDDRWSPPTINVVIKIRGQKKVKFNSGLKGESDRIIRRLQEEVQNTEFIPYQA